MSDVKAASFESERCKSSSSQRSPSVYSFTSYPDQEKHHYHFTTSHKMVDEVLLSNSAKGINYKTKSYISMKIHDLCVLREIKECHCSIGMQDQYKKS